MLITVTKIAFDGRPPVTRNTICVSEVAYFEIRRFLGKKWVYVVECEPLCHWPISHVPKNAAWRAYPDGHMELHTEAFKLVFRAEPDPS